ncbi:hypothetical protein Barb4_03843 [Bacteroidales bacterium Barb4]|nr:hypothetical protein Barb4_03843 [Bacteroidales bacterium Barb4]
MGAAAPKPPLYKNEKKNLSVENTSFLITEAKITTMNLSRRQNMSYFAKKHTKNANKCIFGVISLLGFFVSKKMPFLGKL